LPSDESIPDWRALLSAALIRRRQNQPSLPVKLSRRTGLAAGVMLIIAVMIAILWRNNRHSNRVEDVI